LIDKIPVLGNKVGGMKYGVVSIMHKSIDMSYKKAIDNFVVLGLSLESGVLLPKVVGSCEKFFKSNKKESSFSDEMCSKFDSLFKRIDLGEFEVEDGVWVKEVGVPYLKNRRNALKMAVLKKTIR